MTTEATADRKADAKTIASLQQQLVDSERRAVLVAQGVVAATAAKAAQDQSAAQIKLVTDALHATPKETP